MLSGQGSTLFSGINGMIGVLCAIQLWLVSAGMTALYENEVSALTPAFLASALLFLFNLGLLRYALAFDKLRRSERAGRASRGKG